MFACVLTRFTPSCWSNWHRRECSFRHSFEGVCIVFAGHFAFRYSWRFGWLDNQLKACEPAHEWIIEWPVVGSTEQLASWLAGPSIQCLLSKLWMSAFAAGHRSAMSFIRGSTCVCGCVYKCAWLWVSAQRASAELEGFLFFSIPVFRADRDAMMTRWHCSVFNCLTFLFSLSPSLFLSLSLPLSHKHNYNHPRHGFCSSCLCSICWVWLCSFFLDMLCVCMLTCECVTWSAPECGRVEDGGCSPAC